jgi:hypothetical protein
MIRHKRQPLLGVFSAIGLLLVTLAGSLAAAEKATPGAHSPALVTAEILESKIAEVEAAGWLEVVAVLVNQATHAPVFVLVALALGVLLWRRRYLIGGIAAISDKLGKPTTD